MDHGRVSPTTTTNDDVAQHGSLLRSRSGRSQVTLPVPVRGDGERYVTPARTAAKETNNTAAIQLIPSHAVLDYSIRYPY